MNLASGVAGNDARDSLYNPRPHLVSLRFSHVERLVRKTAVLRRSRDNNPDLDPSFMFPQAVPGLSAGKFPAIPITDADLSPDDHIQAIANTAAFHFAFIEQGGTSLL